MFNRLIKSHHACRAVSNLIVSSLVFSAGAFSASQAAQETIPKPADFPEKPIHLIVPFNAGSPPDILARNIQIGLSKRIGQTVIVENRPGANGNIGTEYVKNMKPDGYSYVICGLTCSTADVFYKKVRYDMRKDMAPVINFGFFPSVLVVSKQSPIKTANELLQYLKEHPGSTYASWGRGGSPHIASEQLSALAHVDILHVPFGSTDPVLDVAAQRITFMFVPAAAATAKTDLLRLLAVASLEREPSLPDLPTLNELGLKGFRMEAWNGLYTAAGAPEDRLEYMNREINALLQEPTMREKIEALGMRIIGGTRQDLAEYFDRDNNQWREVAKSTGIKPE